MQQAFTPAATPSCPYSTFSVQLRDAPKKKKNTGSQTMAAVATTVRMEVITLPSPTLHY